MKTMFRKLKSCAGESIAEVLVALLISALALVMLASMITAATRMVTNSRATMKSYYDANNILAEHSANVPDDAAVSVASGTVSAGVEGLPLTEGAGSIAVSYYINTRSGQNAVVSYGK